MARVIKVVRNEYERQLQNDWDRKTSDPINLLLGRNDDLYHHHFAVGDFDRSVLVVPPELREMAILDEMHRMESAQVGLILEALAALPPGARVMDGGSGRGGTSFMIEVSGSARRSSASISVAITSNSPSGWDTSTAGTTW